MSEDTLSATRFGLFETEEVKCTLGMIIWQVSLTTVRASVERQKPCLGSWCS